MKLIQGILHYANAGLSRKFLSPQVIRTFSTNPGYDVNKLNRSSIESTDDFEQRIFGDNAGKSQTNNSFYRHLDKAERDHNRFWQGSNINSENSSTFLDGLDDSFNTLSDGMDNKLKEAARYFEYDPEEVDKEDYSFRKDVTFWPGNTYDIKDLDLRKPGVQKSPKRSGFETTTEEVLQKADFRNVRFLANFITEAGIIIKRNKTKISAKAQRKIAREIKTARAFGLLPFTTMGTKHFVFGRTMEALEDDYSYETTYSPRNFVDTDASQEPLD
nr:uncharacterized protein LOC109175871 isoform X1 [Ipomoea trifida]